MADNQLHQPLQTLVATLVPAWQAVLAPQSAAIDAIQDQLANSPKPIAPSDPWRFLRFCEPAQIRVILIGQDPYPKPGDAQGMAFSCPGNVPVSMRNVYKALALAKPGFEPPLHADLTPWAQAGVLLLNTALTVEIGHAGSHLAIGWQAVTGAIVRSLLTRDSDPPHVLLWGKPAQTFFDDAANGVSINPAQVLRARHPSNDYQQQFPAQTAAQFLALSRAYPQIDWWALG